MQRKKLSSDGTIKRDYQIKRRYRADDPEKQWDWESDGWKKWRRCQRIKRRTVDAEIVGKIIKKWECWA